MTLLQLLTLGFYLDCSREALDREVESTTTDWYSLDDDGVYRAGKRATYSRIKITAPEDIA